MPGECQVKWEPDSKFSANEEEFEPLLEAARSAQLLVLGVSFHVESSAKRGSAYEPAIAQAKKVFHTATAVGMPRMKILDIGGGLVNGLGFEDSAETICNALKAHFIDEPELTVIAEPGRYFAASIIGKRVRGRVREYWIGDGTHGSFHTYSHDGLDPIPLADTPNPTCMGMRTYPSTVFGPTCDPRDVLVNDYPLPELEVNDWLFFRKMGAYPFAMGTNF